jgi:hypothetical protein
VRRKSSAIVRSRRPCRTRLQLLPDTTGRAVNAPEIETETLPSVGLL